MKIFYYYKDILIQGLDTDPVGEWLRNLNSSMFGTEVDYKKPRTNWAPVDSRGFINMFPKEIYYISPYYFDETYKKYALLNSLPKVLEEKKEAAGSLHGKIVLDIPFDTEYTAEFEFESVNDVLAEIKKGFWTMYAAAIGDDSPYGNPYKYVEELRIEGLFYDLGKETFDIQIGT